MTDGLRDSMLMCYRYAKQKQASLVLQQFVQCV